MACLFLSEGTPLLIAPKKEVLKETWYVSSEVLIEDGYYCLMSWGVVAKRLRAPNSSSDASVQQSMGSNPGRDTCVPEQDT